MTVGDESDVRPGMAGHFDHLKIDSKQTQALAMAYMVRSCWDAFVGRTEQLQAWPTLLELGHTVDVVAMVVGQQDGAGNQAFALCGGYHRRRLPGSTMMARPSAATSAQM